jgi:uncharacterized protein YndB with AHSA1/START domain
MRDIVHDFPIAVSAARVFAAISTPEGLDEWWTKSSSGTPEIGTEYELCFGPGYDWRARVSRCQPNTEFEFEMTDADDDWLRSSVGFTLTDQGGSTQVRFHHTGWPAENEHYRISCFCWAMYLRILKRYLEHGERVPYERRLDV